MKFYFIASVFFIFLNVSCNDIQVTRKNENEIKKIEGTWFMKSNKIIFSNPNFEKLLPGKFILIIEPCSFKKSNNLCSVKFEIDELKEMESSFRLSTNVKRNTIIAMLLDPLQNYSEKEKLFSQSYLEITDRDSNTLNLLVKSSNITYEMYLVKQ